MRVRKVQCERIPARKEMDGACGERMPNFRPEAGEKWVRERCEGVNQTLEQPATRTEASCEYAQHQTPLVLPFNTFLQFTR
eukprot:365213-Rhodomonas_salina.1